ncbi:hypothetical protein GCM10017687_31380 [Streptomyces echinatus]
MWRRAARGGGAGGQAVVDHDHRAALQVRWRAVTAVAPLAAAQFLPLAVHGRGEGVLGEAEVAEAVGVEERRIVRGERADGELLVVRGADLADDEHVERGTEGPGDGLGDGDPTAGQGEDEERAGEVAPLTQAAQQSGECPAGFGAVPEAHGWSFRRGVRAPSLHGALPHGHSEGFELPDYTRGV